MISYKGYLGKMEVDSEAKRIHGRVAGLRDVITFEGSTVEEAERAFRESIDDYLEFCRKRGERPERPYSGNFQLRLGPDRHRRLALLAEEQSISLNELMRRLADQALQKRPSETKPAPKPKTPRSRASRAGTRA